MQISNLPKDDNRRRFANIHVMEDSEELLGMLLDGAHNACKSHRGAANGVSPALKFAPGSAAAQAVSALYKDQASWVSDSFGQVMLSWFRCTCGHVSPSAALERQLVMQLPEHAGELPLQACLRDYFKAEVVDAKCPCESCTGTKTKALQLAVLPEVLVIQLRRSMSGCTDGVLKQWKVHTELDVPAELDMSAYCCHDVMKELQPQRTGSQYQLRAVCHHEGVCSDRGHYWADCRTVADGRWRRFNDCVVTDVSCPSGPSATAFLLFYERVQ